MFLVQSIFTAIDLPKILWNELIKTIIYFKNQSPGINDITFYKLENNIWPNFSHLKMIDF